MWYVFFSRSHPLMDAAVRHEGDAPAFYKRDLVLTTLVVDRQFVDMLGDDTTYTIFYAGTSKSISISFQIIIISFFLKYMRISIYLLQFLTNYY